MEKLDLKKDTAMYRINRIDELKEDSKKYLINLGSIIDECDLKIINLKSEILGVSKRLSPLLQEYNKVKNEYNLIEEKRLTNANKVMNVFYSAFNPNKVKKEIGFDQDKMNELEYEKASNEVEVKYDTKILKSKINKMKELTKKKNVANNEVSKISSFNSRTEDVKSFYKKYLDSFSDFDNEFKKTEKENVFTWISN